MLEKFRANVLKQKELALNATEILQLKWIAHVILLSTAVRT